MCPVCPLWHGKKNAAHSRRRRKKKSLTMHPNPDPRSRLGKVGLVDTQTRQRGEEVWWCFETFGADGPKGQPREAPSPPPGRHLTRMYTSSWSSSFMSVSAHVIYLFVPQALRGGRTIPSVLVLQSQPRPRLRAWRAHMEINERRMKRKRKKRKSKKV